MLRFVDLWKKAHGQVPTHLVFNSKLTTYKNLARLHAQGITFITLRRHTEALKLHVLNARAGAWRRVQLDIPHRKFRTPKVLDEPIQLGKDYPGPIWVAF